MQKKQEHLVSPTEHSDEEKPNLDALPSNTNSETAEESPHKLFVGGLPYNITDPELWEFFSQFGELEESEVMFDRQKRRPRGFGFVTYTNPDVARSLLQMGDGGDGIGRLVFKGKTCEVKAADPKSSDSPARNAKGKSQVAHQYHHQQQHQRSPSFGYDEQFLVLHHPHDNFTMAYPQCVPSGMLSVPGYPPTVLHQPAILPHHPSHLPPQGTIPPFLVPPIATHFYPPTTHQILSNHFFPYEQEHDHYPFVPIPNTVPAPVHFCA